ncbi:MAG: cell division ATP-binding protein FtsE [Clostridia bacterium]|nr:cell division ATP-binding protein FtsE [Clostridia bacterium]
MISLQGVSKVYPNGTVALDQVDLEIQKGEFVFVVGPSGAGKSTVIKLLLHEEVPTEGDVYINDYCVNQLSRKELPYLRRSMGVVFQDFRLLPNKTVYENVAFAMEVVGESKRKMRRTIPSILSMVGLAHKARMKPSELSGGEQQRVALARALVNNPPLLVADEPTGNLDPQTASEIMDLLDQINRRGTTVVVATHAKELVDAMKKRVITIEDGKVAHDEERGAYVYEK